jgi:hypothetical protein
MRLTCFAAASILAAASVCGSQARAFDPIWSVDHWDRARLAEAGISVKPRQYEFQQEHPRMDWVQITFDCNVTLNDEPVVMTARCVFDGRHVASSRVERASAVDGKISLIVDIAPEMLESSKVDIFIWSPTPDGGAEASGYRLSWARIAELARGESDAEPKE